MAYLRDEDYEFAARNLRIALGVDEQLRPNMVEVARLLKRHGYIADYVIAPDAKMQDAKAKYDPDERRLYISESIWQAAHNADPHAIWTIAHEVGHIALNHRKTRNRSVLPQKIEKIAGPVRQDERQADKFAASFLAPFHRSDFTLETTAQQLVKRFGISLPAAILRVKEFEPMFRRLHGISRPLPFGVVDFLAEQRKKGYMVTSLDYEFSLPPSLYYEGDLCPLCKEFRLVRTGLSMKCDNCGTTTGDE